MEHLKRHKILWVTLVIGFCALIWGHVSGNLAPIFAHPDSQALKIVNDHNMSYPSRGAMGGFISNTGIDTDKNYQVAKATTRSDQAPYDVVMVYDKPNGTNLGIMHYYLVDKKNGNSRDRIVDVPDYRRFGPTDKSGEFTAEIFQTLTRVFLYDNAALVVTSNTNENLPRKFEDKSDTLIYYNYSCQKGRVINLPEGFKTYNRSPSVVGPYVIVSNLDSVLVHDMLTGKESRYRLTYFSQLSGAIYQKGRLYYSFYRYGDSPQHYGYSLGLLLETSADPSCSELDTLSSI